MTRYVAISTPWDVSDLPFADSQVYREHETDVVQTLTEAGKWTPAIRAENEHNLQDLIDFYVDPTEDHPWKVRDLVSEEIAGLPE